MNPVRNYVVELYNNIVNSQQYVFRFGWLVVDIIRSWTFAESMWRKLIWSWEVCSSEVFSSNGTYVGLIWYIEMLLVVTTSYRSFVELILLERLLSAFFRRRTPVSTERSHTATLRLWTSFGTWLSRMIFWSRLIRILSHQAATRSLTSCSSPIFATLRTWLRLPFLEEFTRLPWIKYIFHLLFKKSRSRNPLSFLKNLWKILTSSFSSRQPFTASLLLAFTEVWWSMALWERLTACRT